MILLQNPSRIVAQDFDIDTRTGFVPPIVPISRLPNQWEPWERVLDNLQSNRLSLGDKKNLSTEDAARSEAWRARVRELPVLPIADMQGSDVLLRRGHQVLAWILHTYVHTLPSSSPIRIPPPVTIPLLEICALLDLPPVHILSDEAHYNWAFKSGCADVMPTTQNIRSQLLFTGTKDEEEFQLATTRIELRGGEALSLMILILNEGPSIAPAYLASLLYKIAGVIDDVTALLLAVREGCDPKVFYHDVRPWFRGQTAERPWIFEGLEDHPELKNPTELLGTTAGQSPLIHALDVFLGVNSFSHSPGIRSDADIKMATFLERMRLYMPHPHRAFLRHLTSNPRPLRALVLDSANEALDAYNSAVRALKAFRDAHIRIVTIYIMGPARSAQKELVGTSGQNDEGTKGTGGTDLASFLKGVRDLTADTVVCRKGVEPRSNDDIFIN